MSMSQQKKLHFQKTNHHALIRILFLMTLLICNGYQIYLDNTYQIFFILFQGLLLVSLFAPLHECSHSTAFKSKFLNQAVMFFLRDGSSDALDLVQGISYGASPTRPGSYNGS